LLIDGTFVEAIRLASWLITLKLRLKNNGENTSGTKAAEKVDGHCVLAWI